MTGWVGTSLAIAAAIAMPAPTQGQEGAERAAELETEARELQSQFDRWADAAALYLAAAQLRQHEDPQARQDLFIAANLLYEIGDGERAIEALESAGVRAEAGGDLASAADMYARAAWVAQQAGQTLDERRLRYKAFDVADASDLTRAERDRILSRIRG